MALKDKNKSRQRRATTCPKSPKNTPRLDKNTSRAVSEEEFIETMSTMVWLALLFGDGWAYHITPLENLERIKTEGLKSDEEGHVYFLSTNDPNIVNRVALLQVFTREFALLKFNIHDMGFRDDVMLLDAPIYCDNVAEFTRFCQFYIDFSEYRKEERRLLPEEITLDRIVTITDDDMCQICQFREKPELCRDIPCGIENGRKKQGS